MTKVYDGEKVVDMELKELSNYYTVEYDCSDNVSDPLISTFISLNDAVKYLKEATTSDLHSARGWWKEGYDEPDNWAQVLFDSNHTAIQGYCGIGYHGEYRQNCVAINPEAEEVK